MTIETLMNNDQVGVSMIEDTELRAIRVVSDTNDFFGLAFHVWFEDFYSDKPDPHFSSREDVHSQALDKYFDAVRETELLIEHAQEKMKMENDHD